MADTENKPEFDSPALQMFAGGATPTERRDALTSLIAAKFLPKNADHEAITAAFFGRGRHCREPLIDRVPSILTWEPMRKKIARSSLSARSWRSDVHAFLRGGLLRSRALQPLVQTAL
ncbi:hypothetical protein NU688_16785 [Variovorax sp. ZS18.2.2]|uniref:hypothetical protein n=1 Tax=Variovorax sp. ZS18.2.2 TaxID=2971255 RepID=UPI0021519350|nr:hypothetical protein [Variovorax sp. ZS18.2.2]MCR6477820.1 hypothetical protein [Variovorax sp. ZS18.2.2]